jgi:hypothetical protein
MEKKILVCDACGEEIQTRDYKCAVCGKALCSQCESSLLPYLNRTLGTGGGEAPIICPAHYQQVKDYIEGLKQKVKVAHEHIYGKDYYRIEGDEGAFADMAIACGGAVLVPCKAASALYSYMKAEREG